MYTYSIVAFKRNIYIYMLECWYLPPVKQNPRCFSRKITLHIYRFKERDELLTWTRDAQTHPSLRAERGEKQDERTGTTPSRPSLHATTERFSFLLDNLDTINSLCHWKKCVQLDMSTCQTWPVRWLRSNRNMTYTLPRCTNSELVDVEMNNQFWARSVW